jgi:hypothetical protein
MFILQYRMQVLSAARPRAETAEPAVAAGARPEHFRAADTGLHERASLRKVIIAALSEKKFAQGPALPYNPGVGMGIAVQ